MELKQNPGYAGGIRPGPLDKPVTGGSHATRESQSIFRKSERRFSAENATN
jgi:hypothetical protein